MTEPVLNSSLHILHPEVEPLAVTVSVEVWPQVQLVVGVGYPHRLAQVTGLKPVTKISHEDIRISRPTCSRSGDCLARCGEGRGPGVRPAHRVAPDLPAVRCGAVQASAAHLLAVFAVESEVRLGLVVVHHRAVVTTQRLDLLPKYSFFSGFLCLMDKYC